jgi:hypothetical protein
MKKICFLCLCLGLLLAACGGNARKESPVADAQEEVAVSDGVEVLYFHGKQRCATCIAIEKGTQEVMEKRFGRCRPERRSEVSHDRHQS